MTQTHELYPNINSSSKDDGLDLEPAGYYGIRCWITIKLIFEIIQAETHSVDLEEY